jgi:hypothetical protein
VTLGRLYLECHFKCRVIDRVAWVHELNSYRIGDNIEWLAKLGWINVDPNEAERISKLFQFWAYLFSVVTDPLIHS